MTTILIAGVAVIDFVFSVDQMPRLPQKYRARDAAVVGGGCAANAAVAVARQGGTARLASRLGCDRIGDMIIADLEAEGVDCSLCRRFEGGRSSYSSVFVDAEGDRQIVNFRDETISFDGQWLDQLIPDEFDAALADTRWPEGACSLMRAARKQSRPGVLDAEAPLQGAEEAVRLASHVAFSAQGLRDFTGEDDLRAGLAVAAVQTGAWICVTDGEAGVTWLDEGKFENYPAFKIDAVDTLGAGDVWHGAFALGLGEGQSEIDAIRFASAVAAIKCTRFGGRSGVPDRQETEAFLREFE